MRGKSTTIGIIKKEEKLTKFQALSVYRAFKHANPGIKTEIKKLKHELLHGLSRHDRASGIWFLNVYKKVFEIRSKNISLETLMEAYKTDDKNVIAKKLLAYYSNYGIAEGVILGSSAGFLGFISEASSTFGEIVCLTYFQLSLIYDLSILFERPLIDANNLEIYRVLKASFDISEKDLIRGKVYELVDKGDKFIEEKLLKNDGTVLQSVLKNLGVAIYYKAEKNFLAKAIPILTYISGPLVCITSDYEAVKAFGKRTLNIYSGIV